MLETLSTFHPLLVLSILLLSGWMLGQAAKKVLIPAIIGQILAGFLLGPHSFKLFDYHVFESFQPLTHFALALFGLTLGTHLHIARLHNSVLRISTIMGLEILIVPGIIFLTLHYLLGIGFSTSLLLSAMGLSTSPTSIIHLLTERRSRGTFSKTLISTVALNNIATLCLFTIVMTMLSSGTSPSLASGVAKVAVALLLGIAQGALLLFITRHQSASTIHFSLLIFSILFITGLCQTLKLPAFLASIALGFMIANYSSKKSSLLNSITNIEPGLYTLFFVLAGTHLDFSNLREAGIAGLLFIVARFIGKTLAPALGARITRSSESVSKYLPLALYPHAAIAISCLLMVEQSTFLASEVSYLTTVILCSVVFFELFGPLMTDYAIRKSGEQGKDRERLLDFLHEEYILTPLRARDKKEVLEELGAFMHRVHAIREVSQSQLIDLLLERENKMSTGLGEGIAVPHAIIEGGPQVRGVIGISKQGIDFKSLDKKPVHIIIVVATPQEHYDQHLKVLAGIARIFGHDPELKEVLVNARNAAEIVDILNIEHVEMHNIFLEK